jgi:hypothetical protein
MYESEAALANAEIELYRRQISILKAEVEHLKSRKCSHGDYRMQGTTDCKNAYSDCDGRTEFYVIGEGLCISCRHKKEREGALLAKGKNE